MTDYIFTNDPHIPVIGEVTEERKFAYGDASGVQTDVPGEYEATEEKEGVRVSERLRSIHASFSSLSVSELEDAILLASDRDEKILYRTLLNLKMQLDQEKIINQTLL